MSPETFNEAVQVWLQLLANIAPLVLVFSISYTIFIFFIKFVKGDF